MTEPEEYGPLLRAHRQAAGLTLEELAGASGVSARAISDMERGRSRGPQRRTVVALADALRLAPAEHAGLLAAAGTGRARSVPAPAPVGLCELPRSAPDFTGRHGALDQLDALAAGAAGAGPAGAAGAGAAAVAVVSGPAGLGKTAFAVHAAHLLGGSFPDGAFFLDLRGMDPEPLDSGAALGRLARALGTPAHLVPPDPQQRAGLYRTLLRDKRALIVLDNATDEAQVRPLLPAGGRSLTLVTSRRQLAGLEGVRRLYLGALSPAEAIDLLRTILAAGGEASDPEAIGEVAALCGHLPLALRIAANRLLSRPGWTPRDLAARLRKEDRRLDQLVAGDLRVAAAFGLSYDQLSAPARQLFRRLALVPGPDFSAPLAAALDATGLAPAEDALDELAELALLQPAPAGRYRFHDLVRLYARERLGTEEPPAERAAAAARMEDWLLDVGVVAGRWYEPDYGAPVDWTGAVPLSSPEEALAWLQAEGDNWLAALRSAAAGGRHTRVVEAAEAMHWISDRWVHWGHWHEVYRLASVAATALGDPVEEARQLNYLSWAENMHGAAEAALATAVRAGELAGTVGDRVQLAWSHYYVAWALRDLGRPAEMGGPARAAAALFEAEGDSVGLVVTLNLVVDAELAVDRPGDALGVVRRILSVVDDPATGMSAVRADGLRSRALARLGRVYARTGRPAEAADQLRRAAVLLYEQGVLWFAAGVEEDLAGVLLAQGDREGAAAAYRRAADVHAEIGAGQEAERVRALLAALPPG